MRQRSFAGESCRTSEAIGFGAGASRTVARLTGDRGSCEKHCAACAGESWHRSLVLALALFIFPSLIGCATKARPIAGSRDEPVYRHGAVAADHAVASEAGLEMLKRGGNAVDAAVATSFCLSVVRPFSCGIGGGGFMLIYSPPRSGKDGRTVALNYRETCPTAVGPDFYAELDDKEASRFGWRASGVPGTVAGLCKALEDHGTLGLKVVLEPAIRAAEAGFVADHALVEAVESVVETLARRPDVRAALGSLWVDVCRDGKVKIGDVIRNPEQARTLQLIAEQGPAAFYEGEIAHAIASTMREHAGTLALDDLAGYRVREMQPLEGSFNERILLSMPPPSSGGVAMQEALGILGRYEKQMRRHNSADYVHVVTEAFKNAFADRARFLADPDFEDVPEFLTWHMWTRNIHVTMDHTLVTDAYGGSGPVLEPVTQPAEDQGTSHFCVLDEDGMAVACTETINLDFGSLVCVPGFGFCLNNEMDDFTTKPGAANSFGLQQSEKNLPEPGKRPLSSMSPTIMTKNGKVVLIAGASGGPRIITATTQCMLNVLLFDMTPEQAVKQPRFHHQWMPNKLLVDQLWKDAAVLDDLKRRGHEIGTLTDEAAVQMIAVDEDGNIRAASDPRKGGRPAGY